jgi:SNF2 family DNA or RNA helicase
LISFEEKPTTKKKAPVAEKGPPKKIDALMNLIVDHPNDKFLVFSRYENPFQLMQERLTEKKISVQTVKGSKDVVNNLLTRFDEGDVRVLLLNAAHAGSGLNITAATYVVLWHAMTAEEEKQILGRAYRMGRSKPLNFVKLVHPDEVRS